MARKSNVILLYGYTRVQEEGPAADTIRPGHAVHWSDNKVKVGEGPYIAIGDRMTGASIDTDYEEGDNVYLVHPQPGTGVNAIAGEDVGRGKGRFNSDGEVVEAGDGDTPQFDITREADEGDRVWIETL